MDTTIDQQVAMDEALVPYARRLRIGRSNFRLLSDISSKESTLQLVYDVLCLTPFFKAFLVIADVSEIYMQEFWATATGKQAARASKAKSLSALSEVAMTDVQQLKLVTKKSLQQTYISQASGFGVDEGTGDDDEGKDDIGDNDNNGDDGEEGDGDDNDKEDDGEEGDDDDDQEVEKDDQKDDEEEGNGEENLGLNVGREEGHDKEEEEDELYRDVNINQGRGIQTTLEVEDSHVTLTPVNLDGQQQSSSVTSQFVTTMLNPILDAGMESIFETASQIDVQTPTSVAPLPMFLPTITPSTIATITTTQQAPLPPITASSTLLQDLPNFGSLFGFDNRLRTLETNFSKFMQTNQFARAVSPIPGIVQQYMDQRLNEAVKKIIKEHVKEQVKKMEGNKSIQRFDEQRNPYKALVEAYESYKIILDTYRETVTLKRHDDDQEDEGNDKDDQEEGSDDEQAFNKEEFIHPSLSTHDEEETRDEESFDPITKTPENTDDEGNGIESIFKTTSQMDVQTPTSVAHLTVSGPTLTPLTIATVTITQQAPTPPTTALSTLLQDLPNFGSLFGFDHRLKTLEANFSEFMQINQFAGAVFSIPRIVQRYMDQQMNKAVKIEQTVNEQLKAKVLTRSSNSSKTSYIVATDLSEIELKKIFIEKMKGNKSIHRSNEQMNPYKDLIEAYKSNKIILDTYKDTVMLKRHRDDDADKDEESSVGSDRGSKRQREGKEPESVSAPKEKATRSAEFETCADDQPIVEPSQHPEWFSQQKTPPTPDRDWNKTLLVTHESIHSWISELAKKSDSRSSFNELMDTPVDFSAFLMNRLKVDTLTPKLLAGPTYKLIKGSCKGLVELEFFLEEVYNATTDQLDWVNPEGQQYPHNLLNPIPLIPNSRDRYVIPFDHFINNDLEYLRGSASSRKHTTSVTKTKAADYGHIKWIEDLFYGFAINWESDRDVYSKRRIIAVTKHKIIEWHNYKHLDWITVRRDDDKLYKFKEGDFKRLRIQDTDDMCMKDLQLSVQNYQKKLNLTRPDTYRSDLKRKEAYIAYSNPRGFIYQNKDKQNRLIRIDELHKFSDGTLIDFRTALDDRFKGIRMKYLPQTI
uniref:Uncharacterized protein n=1 Tax=Tanacetum cinerariifolium TaxID=118510 RepID=A0A6L2K322_TANCI|nr:hypothetical protein [Tanacetum cinerariifolium]